MTNRFLNQTGKGLRWEQIRLNAFRLAQAHVSPTEVGIVSHVSSFHYWKHPKNIELK